MRNKKELKIRNEKIILVILTVAVIIWTIININSIFKVMENVKKLEASKNENVVNTVVQGNIVTAEEIEENTNQLEIEDLKDKDERTRIQQYCGKFIRYIESKDYDKKRSLFNKNYEEKRQRIILQNYVSPVDFDKIYNPKQ